MTTGLQGCGNFWKRQQRDSYLDYLLDLDCSVDVDSISSVVARAVDGTHCWTLPRSRPTNGARCTGGITIGCIGRKGAHRTWFTLSAIWPAHPCSALAVCDHATSRLRVRAHRAVQTVCTSGTVFARFTSRIRTLQDKIDVSSCLRKLAVSTPYHNHFHQWRITFRSLETWISPSSELNTEKEESTHNTTIYESEEEKNCKNLNLPPVKMSHGSFIVIRNSHAQNNQLVRPVGYAY